MSERADEIQRLRDHLAARTTGERPAIKRAVGNLDRWLEVLTEPPDTHAGIDAADCTRRAVAALERALGS